MTWIEMLWWWFWALVARRQHERPHSPGGLFPLAARTAPAGCRAAWKETTDLVQHSAGCLRVARPSYRSSSKTVRIK